MVFDFDSSLYRIHNIYLLEVATNQLTKLTETYKHPGSDVHVVREQLAGWVKIKVRVGIVAVSVWIRVRLGLHIMAMYVDLACFNKSPTFNSH